MVAENGAVLYVPATRELRLLGEPPPPSFTEALRRKGVPAESGKVIVATSEPHQAAVLEAIKELGLELHVEFNKGAVMVLPAGTTKRTGLAEALEGMRLSAHNVVGVGDAENDHAFLSFCECAIGVSNALPSLKERCDWVTPSAESAGVVELLDRVLADDLQSLPGREDRMLRVGHTLDGKQEVRLDAYESCVLVAGPSGSGKSTIAVSLLERLLEEQYQLCVIDPEGDHEPRALLAGVGTMERPPTVDEVVALLEDPSRSIVATLLAVPLAERPRWFGAMRARIEDLRQQTGRPHWVMVDEAHHLLPAARDASATPLPRPAAGLLFVTVDPSSMSPQALSSVNLVICTARQARETLGAFAAAVGQKAPEVPPLKDGPVLWEVGRRRAVAVEIPPPKHHHLRHKRKYARGDVGEDKSFYFRGPRGALHLRAQNLVLFVQIGAGVDDDTWEHHLRAGDYSRWFREAIKDEALADDTATVEHDRALGPAETRSRIRAAIEERYTLPA